MAKITKVDVLTSFVTHHQDRLLDTLKTGPLTPQQEATCDALVFAVEALKSRDLFEVASAYLSLGMALADEDYPGKETIISGIYAMRTKMKQEEAREGGKRLARKNLKNDTQAKALKIWEADTDQKIRTGAMYDKIFRTLELAVKDAGIPMPIENTVKGWLREIAPEYAKKGGAPKKIKQK